jgi:hypothetical protein
VVVAAAAAVVVVKTNTNNKFLAIFNLKFITKVNKSPLSEGISI